MISLINYIWGIIIIVSAVFGIFSGNADKMTNAFMEGADSAVNMTVSLLGIMCFWTGIMEIAENTGVTDLIGKILNPLVNFLFPKLKDNEVKKAIVMNITANMLGMSNAATPLGLKAMERLKKYAKKNTATDDMCMFVVINTASIQIIPSTVIAIRQSAGSVNPTEIIPAVWLCSILALTVGVISAKINSLRRFD